MPVDVEALNYLGRRGKFAVPELSHSSQSSELIDSEVILESPNASRKRQLEATGEEHENFRSPLPTKYPVELSPPCRRSFENPKNKYGSFLLGQPLSCSSPNKNQSTEDQSLHFQVQKNNFSGVNEIDDCLDLNKVFSKKSSFVLKPRLQKFNCVNGCFQSERRIKAPDSDHIPEIPRLFPDFNIERLQSLKSQGNFKLKVHNSNPSRLAKFIPTKSGLPKRAPSA